MLCGAVLVGFALYEIYTQAFPLYRASIRKRLLLGTPTLSSHLTMVGVCRCPRRRHSWRRSPTIC